jgi:tripartite-type tricarboxylate transporter receptor subunit TctC
MLTDLIGVQVQIKFDNLPSSIQLIKAGRLRALAVTSPKRTKAAPDVPTVSEAGLKGYEMVLYSGILGPANMPRDIVSRLNAEIGKAIRSPELKPILDKVGAEPVTMTPEQFAAHLRSEIEKLGAIVRSVGAHVD